MYFWNLKILWVANAEISELKNSEAQMEGTSIVHETVFPVPARGVTVACRVNMDSEVDIPLVYFGRESHESGVAYPDSPVVLVSDDRFKSRGSTNPLNSVVRRLEAQLARHGGLLESSEFVSSNGRGDDRYYHADDFLDNGDEDEGDCYETELDLSAFRVLETVGGDHAAYEEDEEEVTDNEEEDNQEAGGNWQTLLSRLDSTRQNFVRDVVVELETVQSFPGHTRQKKQKSLRELTAKLRRLLPKINQVQAHWQAAVWEVVTATNSTATMQGFLDLWNDVSTQKQREEFAKERSELVEKLQCADLYAAWKKGEAIVRARHDAFFSNISRLWELWNFEEECSGRPCCVCSPNRAISRTEKRFAAHFSDIYPAADLATTPYILRIALFGQKGASKSLAAPVLGGMSDVDDSQISNVSNNLPLTVYLYKKNELLKCKITEIKSLTQQTVQVIDKEWVAAEEFESLAAVFESYQQKYVRKQDRSVLASPIDAWKNFAVKVSSTSYMYLFDIASKATSLATFAFNDKMGHPIFVPSITAARLADLEKRKKSAESLQERKKKRKILQQKQQESEFRKIPYSEFFAPFPDFDKSLFKPAVIDVT